MRKNSARRRNGLVLAIALVAIAIASVVLLAIVKTAVAERRAMDVRQWQAQALWLADSGLERAAARLAADPDYRGETWHVPADELDGKAAAVVRIEIEPDGAIESRRQIRVQADYPDTSLNRARCSRQIAVDL